MYQYKNIDGKQSKSKIEATHAISKLKLVVMVL